MNTKRLVPLILAPRKHRQVDLCESEVTLIYIEVQASQGYSETLSQKSIQNALHCQSLLTVSDGQAIYGCGKFLNVACQIPWNMTFMGCVPFS